MSDPRKTPAERFQDAAPRTTRKIIAELRRLELYGHQPTYSFDEAEAVKIFEAIEAATKRAKEAFRRADEPLFDL